MAPETGAALLVLVAFVLPGFIAVLIAERTFEVPVRQRTPFELLLLTGYYSVVSYGIVGLVSWPFHLSRTTLKSWYHEGSLGRLVALGLVAVVIVPAAVATLARIWMHSSTRRWALRKMDIHEAHRVPTGWDEFFRRGQPAFVRLVLTDGRVVGGLYSSRSFSGYAEQNGDLLLEEAWALDEDDWFDVAAPRTAGLWMPARSIVSMELYNVSDDEAESAELSEEAAEG